MEMMGCLCPTPEWLGLEREDSFAPADLRGWMPFCGVCWRKVWWPVSVLALNYAGLLLFVCRTVPL
jgi:hypothetical protein